MADHAGTEVLEDRPLSDRGKGLVKWLLEHGTSEARELLPQLDRARVVSRCSCSCASVDFSVDGKVAQPKSGMSVVSDYRWDNPEGYLFGVFVYARQGLLSGIDLRSIDGCGTANALPNTDQLCPLDK
jgi:hypothetical protein